MLRTSSYLLECLDSRPDAPRSALPGLAEWLGDLVTGQHLWIRSDDNRIGVISGPRNELGDVIDHFWCRDLLREVPSIVKRVQKLEDLKTEQSPSEIVQLYFGQAMRCLVTGMFEASCALTRACLEQALRDAVPQAEGIVDLEALIRWAGHSRKLDTAHMQMADTVRRLGNDVMHKRSCTEDQASEAAMMLRAVVGVLYGTA